VNCIHLLRKIFFVSSEIFVYSVSREKRQKNCFGLFTWRWSSRRRRKKNEELQKINKKQTKK